MNIFLKKAAVEQKTSECWSNIQREDEPETDYMEYFFKETNEARELNIILQKNLNKLSNDELNELALNILSECLGFFRYSSEIKGMNSDLSFMRFHSSVVWHLSDSIHNIPGHLNERLPLISYISEFFIFVEVFNKIEMKPIPRTNERFYLNLHLKEKWNYLYSS